MDRQGPRFGALERIEFPELHEESIPEARFISNLYVPIVSNSILFTFIYKDGELCKWLE